MNKITLLSLVTATVLFTACGEDAKKTVTDAATSVSDSVKETATSVSDTVKETATKAVDATKEAAEAASDKAAEVAEAASDKAVEVKEATEKKAADAATALKERAAATTEAVKEAVTPENAAGKAAYAKCAGCHGADGKTKALGKSPEVAGQPVATLVEALKGYKAGTRNISGMGMLMKGQVASMDDATITAVSEYMSAM
ncbi:MAG: Cytochrome C553 (soluble cytochrome f) [uncultured Sulfurovum sp.]|uniref:Cytochrome C553 (Soluble cytochrome f) n=1 Tax=uncultured Sulfurovum sp. TaxID=269237 RepID=A0A6S6SKX1_9BACT|nr:MAG: Cytochrome C553 (soluble cytochrome f) [uncultured Sulfurovum sp.]